jgi:aminoglycoside phosphotransferase (APT) family kinase protein
MARADGIDLAALRVWFPQHVAASRAPLEVSLISGGHSNLTYRVDDANGGIFALRRPPLGDIPRSAHDVLREHRILSALQRTAVPVPCVEAVCRDLTVIGAPFYVMRWVDGRIADRLALVDEILATTQARRRAAISLIDGLADLHRLDVDLIGLGDLGRREEYLPRQLERLRRVWDKTRTRDLPIIESLHARLLERKPPQRYTGLVHADYRLGNLMLGADGRIAAVLDWELCALGDVLTDLGHLLDNWDEPADSWPNVWMEIAPTRAGGFPSREELVARYAQKTGFEVSNLDYYRAFGYWRIAVIAEGMKRRYESGAMGTHTADSADLDRRVRERAQLADFFLTRAGG